MPILRILSFNFPMGINSLIELELPWGIWAHNLPYRRLVLLHLHHQSSLIKDNCLTRLGSVAGTVIQVTRRPKFENGLRMRTGVHQENGWCPYGDNTTMLVWHGLAFEAQLNTCVLYGFYYKTVSFSLQSFCFWDCTVPLIESSENFYKQYVYP